MFCPFVCLLCSSGCFLLNTVELLPFLFSFVNDHLNEPVEMLTFPPSIFGSRIVALFAATFVIHVSQLRYWFIFYSSPFLIIANTFSLY